MFAFGMVVVHRVVAEKAMALVLRHVGEIMPRPEVTWRRGEALGLAVAGLGRHTDVVGTRWGIVHKVDAQHRCPALPLRHSRDTLSRRRGGSWDTRATLARRERDPRFLGRIPVVHGIRCNPLAAGEVFTGHDGIERDWCAHVELEARPCRGRVAAHDRGVCGGGGDGREQLLPRRSKGHHVVDKWLRNLPGGPGRSVERVDPSDPHTVHVMVPDRPGTPVRVAARGAVALAEPAVVHRGARFVRVKPRQRRVGGVPAAGELGTVALCRGAREPGRVLAQATLALVAVAVGARAYDGAGRQLADEVDKLGPCGRKRTVGARRQPAATTGVVVPPESGHIVGPVVGEQLCEHPKLPPHKLVGR
mmetsp:Transcript_31224/g.93687  ORF Transcript_31224/g.93687 Transcript_31224/m.93687 type:complete len:362 (+) Transcript_31224:330-1415(+)